MLVKYVLHCKPNQHFVDMIIPTSHSPTQRSATELWSRQVGRCELGINAARLHDMLSRIQSVGVTSNSDEGAAATSGQLH